MTNNRLFYLDNLKIALTMLVVAHHAGQPYGGSNGFWYYQTDEAIHLGPFFSVNAGFFMSLFFFISAYFFPGSAERKGPGEFAKAWLLRLGLPLLGGFLILMPLLMYGYYANFRDYGSVGFFDYYANIYLGFGDMPAGWTGPSWPDMQFGHLWFIEHLLVYAVLYALIRKLLGRSPKIATVKKPVGQWGIVTFCCLVALVTYWVRINYPIDTWVGFLGIIQTEFAHIPQYIAFFIAGIAAYHRGWLQTLSRSVGLTWLTIGLALAVSKYTGWVRLYSQGGANGDSLAYAFYETFLCAGLSIGLIYLFREFANRSTRWTAMLSPNTFAVYILHVPVVVGLQYALDGVAMPTALEFLTVTIGGIILTFTVSHLIRAAFRQLRPQTSQRSRESL